MAEKLKSPPPDRNPKTPKLKAPPGATDTHFHLYGPQLRFPFNPNSPLDVEDSTLDDMLHLHNTLGDRARRHRPIRGSGQLLRVHDPCALT